MVFISFVLGLNILEESASQRGLSIVSLINQSHSNHQMGVAAMEVLSLIICIWKRRPYCYSLEQTNKQKAKFLIQFK